MNDLQDPILQFQVETRLELTFFRNIHSCFKNKLNLGHTFTQRQGHKAHNRKMAYLKLKRL